MPKLHVNRSDQDCEVQELACLYTEVLATAKMLGIANCQTYVSNVATRSMQFQREAHLHISKQSKQIREHILIMEAAFAQQIILLESVLVADHMLRTIKLDLCSARNRLLVEVQRH